MHDCTKQNSDGEFLLDNDDYFTNSFPKDLLRTEQIQSMFVLAESKNVFFDFGTNTLVLQTCIRTHVQVEISRLVFLAACCKNYFLSNAPKQ